MTATGVQSGDKAFLVINGVGATTLMEMNLVYRRAHQVLEEKGIEVVPGLVAELLTVQEMGGFQMILCKLDDDHAENLKAPAKAPYWTV
jgi:dihydroxyacetone kinase-like protein